MLDYAVERYPDNPTERREYAAIREKVDALKPCRPDGAQGVAGSGERLASVSTERIPHVLYSDMWTLRFYTTAAGSSPVEEYVVALPAKERASVDRALLRLREIGLSLGMPHVRPLRDKLWELRSHGPNQQHRVLYVAIEGQTFLLLHGFTKKTEATPEREMTVADQRLADWQSRKS